MMYSRSLVPHVIVAIVLLVVAMGCHGEVSMSDTEEVGPPEELIGSFQDDYGITYSISDSSWHQHPLQPYRIQEWLSDTPTVLLTTIAADGSDSTWLRIDWIQLENMPPWKWAFCISKWGAGEREVLFDSLTINLTEPKSGCGGYPFSRMRPRTDSSTTANTPYSP